MQVYRKNLDLCGSRKSTQTRWLHCVECQQYRIRIKVPGYLCTSCLLPAFDETLVSRLDSTVDGDWLPATA